MLTDTNIFLPLIRKSKGRIINTSVLDKILKGRSSMIEKASADRNPKIRYLIGPGAKKMNSLRKFPVKM